ncbi:hypothetical protein HCU01_01270 [Halomonas cupida]|uniref:Phage major capsid protein, HK97 family n=1 Tax=Halomonas cupida TaxID=44933 RepID=A0A1M7B1L2_9GAMM|nr:hypothetical protein [Halomonas cupida]GEN22178.1 hypothetical protein HCU01_01270 [Halomonas cupida]SHL48786.1 hypothetical protein SAMN05660971_00722 [Halomonas cupida]
MHSSRLSNPRLRAFHRLVALKGLTEPKQFHHALASSDLPLLRDYAQEKASAMTAGDIGANEGLDELTAAYLASHLAFSLVDQLVAMAPALPVGMNRILLAGGTSAEVTPEGAAKVATTVALSLADAPPTKVSSLVVVSREFLATGAAAEVMVLSEMGTALDSTANAAIVAAFPESVSLPGSGDAEADLKSGISASQPSLNGYLILAAPSVAAELALSDKAGAGMSVSGGSYIDGIQVVADDAMTSGMVILPVSRVMIRDDGLFLRTTEQDAIQMVDTPTPTPTQMVSLFQTNSVALLLERRWRLATQDAVIVEVGVSS